MASLFGRATPHSPGRWQQQQGQGPEKAQDCKTMNVWLLNKSINVLNTMNVQKAVNDTHSKCLASTLRREAKVFIPPPLTSQVSVHTSAQSLGKPNQQVLEVSPLTCLASSQSLPVKPLAEPAQHSILGLPVVHLSLSLVIPPWTQLSYRGILPMAETICQSTQTFAGRVSQFRSKWEALTREPWDIQTVSEGYHILPPPHQLLPPCNPHLSTEDTVILRVEIQSLLQKQAICQISVSTKGFYFNMFTVPKKDGGQRPVINLKHLNKFVKSEHFKMEGLHTVKALLRQNDWMAKVDLKDAFFMVPIAPQHRTCFSLGWREGHTNSNAFLSAFAQPQGYLRRSSSHVLRCSDPWASGW